MWDGLLQLEGLSEDVTPLRPSSRARAGSIDGVVRYGSVELAALHEAGHAAAAVLVGAPVVWIALDLWSAEPGGATRVRRPPDQTPLIALGGFAAELRLWREGRLQDSEGVPIAWDDLMGDIARSTQDDRIKYFGRDARGPDGRWPAAFDRGFIDAAQDLRARLDTDLMDRIASDLLRRGSLDGREFQRLRRPPSRS